MDATTLPPGHVANPAYRALFQAYAAAFGSIDEVRDALDPPSRTLNVTDAWLGPEARAWSGELTTQQGNLGRASDQILWDIYDRLSATQRSLPVN
ncbi:hypothetical protein [Actinocorallia lasiicapitis]